MSVRQHWSGDDWEIYAKQLLIVRFGIRYQPVFDRDRGDWGIEGYVASEATVFQCYAAQDARDATDLYKKQRDKMTADLAKLVKNRLAIAGAVGCPVDTWILLVPDCDSKRILEHAGRKQQELRRLGHPELGAGFVIGVLTHSEFEAEKSQLSADRIRLPEEEPAQANLDQAPFLADLRSKAEVLAPSSPEALTDRFAHQYIRAQGLLQRIKVNYPQVWTDIDETIRARERGLETTSLLGNEPMPPLSALVADMEARLLSAASGIGDGTALDVAWGTLADWLIRCPLDPRPAP